MPQPVDILLCNEKGRSRGDGWCYPKKVEKLLQELTAGKSVLQLFGGKSSWGVRLDIDPSVRPDVVGDAWLPPFARDSFDVVILDPPYFRLNSQEKVPLFLNAAWIARERVIWFHTLWISQCVRLKPERAWLVRVGDNSYCRCLQVFGVPEPERKLPPSRYFTRGPAIKYNRWLAGERPLPLGLGVEAG